MISILLLWQSHNNWMRKRKKKNESLLCEWKTESNKKRWYVMYWHTGKSIGVEGGILIFLPPFLFDNVWCVSICIFSSLHYCLQNQKKNCKKKLFFLLFYDFLKFDPGLGSSFHKFFPVYEIFMGILTVHSEILFIEIIGMRIDIAKTLTS